MVSSSNFQIKCRSYLTRPSSICTPVIHSDRSQSPLTDSSDSQSQDVLHSTVAVLFGVGARRGQVRRPATPPAAAAVGRLVLDPRLRGVEVEAAVLDALEDVLGRLDEGVLDLLSRLGGRLDEGEAVLLGELLRLLERHVALRLEITFVTNQKYHLKQRNVLLCQTVTETDITQISLRGILHD